MRTTGKFSGHRPKPTNTFRKIEAIDLFCGAGGLTRGLEKAGIDVAVGIDIDPACAYPYSANNRAEFLLKSVADLSSSDLPNKKRVGNYRLLAGCAPCQPFSKYQQKLGPDDERWHLLAHFGRLAKEIRPDFITMENVPNLRKQAVFRSFVRNLKKLGYHVHFEVVHCADFGIPQQRQRLVLLASQLGEITLVRPSRAPKTKTVRQAIAKLPAITAGQVYAKDPMHQSATLTALNLDRIRASMPGGSWNDWDEELVAACHRRDTGKTYPGVYGRMEWDAPSPTITTQYFGFGNGRFGHPEQDRALSLREGAILQSFPKNYKFVKAGGPIHYRIVGRLIGNAVPVKLGEAIGRSIVKHARSHERTSGRGIAA